MKHRLLIIVLSCLCVQFLFAQGKSYRAVYETGRNVPIGAGNYVINYGFKKVDIITDSSYYQYPAGYEFADTTKRIFGNRILQHSSYYFTKDRQGYYGVNRSKGKGRLEKVKQQKLFSSNWIKIPSFKQNFMGFECEKAYRVRAGKDTLFAVYCPGIPYPPGLPFLNDLPGLMVYQYDATYQTHTRILSLEMNDFEIVLPANRRQKR